MDTIAVVDFGGQYAHLIANRIRRLGAFSEIMDNSAPAAAFERFKGIVLSGGPRSVTDEGAPVIDAALLQRGVPVLGLCYGHQLVTRMLGGVVRRGAVREYGVASLSITADDAFFAGISSPQQVWMSHGDTVTHLPEDFAVLGATADCEFAAVRHVSRPIYGLQFHPEVTDTPSGMNMLDNFLSLCGCAREWNTDAFLREITEQTRRQCAGRKVFLLVSGGVDSSVAFVLLNNLLGPQRVQGLHIDTGLMRADESAEVMRSMHEHGLSNLQVYDAADEFIAALDGVCDPEEKRRIIGHTFVTVQRQTLRRLGLNAREWMLGQGTIYPDTIESAGTRHADRIKTHHNRVAIIAEMLEQGLVVEPLAQLYKDEVRQLGEALGLPRHLVWRHPFPGPGLGVRVLCCEGNAEPVDADVDAAVSRIAAQYGYRAAVLPVRSVGVQGDERTYAHPVLLTGSRDAEALERVSTGITNSVAGVNRVLFGLSVAPECHWVLQRSCVTAERLALLRAIDSEATRLLRAHGQYDSIWQMPVMLLPLCNARNGQCVVFRPVVSSDAMTARFVLLDAPVVEGLRAFAAHLPGIGDLFLDITHKPPGTIEWE